MLISPCTTRRPQCSGSAPPDDTHPTLRYRTDSAGRSQRGTTGGFDHLDRCATVAAGDDRGPAVTHGADEILDLSGETGDQGRRQWFVHEVEPLLIAEFSPPVLSAPGRGRAVCSR